VPTVASLTLGYLLSVAYPAVVICQCLPGGVALETRATVIPDLGIKAQILLRSTSTILLLIILILVSINVLRPHPPRLPAHQDQASHILSLLSNPLRFPPLSLIYLIRHLVRHHPLPPIRSNNPNSINPPPFLGPHPHPPTLRAPASARDPEQVVPALPLLSVG